MNLKLVTLKQEELIPAKEKSRITRALRDLPVEVFETEPILDLFVPIKEGQVQARYEPAQSSPNSGSHDTLRIYGIHRRTTFTFPKGLDAERYVAAFNSDERLLAINDKKEGLVFMIS